MVQRQREISVDKPKQLLVEGRDEELFFDGLLSHLGIDDVQIQNCGGKDNFRNRLDLIANSPEFDQVRSIGIVKDADASAASAFQSIQGNLSSVELPAPGEVLVPAGDSPSVAVFIMPSNADTGALEDLCLSALEGDPAMRCVSDFIQCVQQAVDNTPENPAKARIHAFLSSREDPELRLGEAAQRGYLPWGAAAFEQLIQFVRDL